MKIISLYEFICFNKDHLSLIKIKYLALLNQLTVTPELADDLFLENVEKIHKMGVVYIGILGQLQDACFEIICSGTIIIEPKLIRNGKCVGHIEDIVIDANHRKKGVSQILLDTLKLFGKEQNCYKFILDCDNDVAPVYEKNNFIQKGVQMALYY